MAEMYEKVLPTDRWPNRVISPIDFEEDAEGLPVVILHPGWGKKPEMHTKLLQELAGADFRPIGFDTRYGYTDQNLDSSVGPLQRMFTGAENQFFNDLSTNDNRYFYRRPTGLLQGCVDLGIKEAHFVGHSEGVRIGLTAARADNAPVQFKSMILVNGVGTGEAGGIFDMLLSTLQAAREHRADQISSLRALGSFRNSSFHFMTHLRRTLREERNIKGYTAREDIGELALAGTSITVVKASKDRLIKAGSAEQIDTAHPNVSYIETEGFHSSVYGPRFRELIVSELIAKRQGAKLTT